MKNSTKCSGLVVFSENRPTEMSKVATSVEDELGRYELSLTLTSISQAKALTWCDSDKRLASRIKSSHN